MATSARDGEWHDHAIADLGPRDMIDLQSFIWVQGSDEYDYDE